MKRFQSLLKVHSFLGLAMMSLGILLAPAMEVEAQTTQKLNENCIVSVLNRNTRVRPDGTWVLPNIPANFGLVRARATCVFNGQTISGESAPFLVLANNSVNVPPIVLGPTTPIPTSLQVTVSAGTLASIGATSQAAVLGTYSDGSTRTLTAASTGTLYIISNAAIARITSDGLVTGLASGTALIQATNEGTSGFTSIKVVLTSDSDGDGIADDLELTLGLDPNNPADAKADRDHDGLSNKDEADFGTNLDNPDTDSDGLLDGEEVKVGADGFVTNPLLADTDGDGVRDALEVASGSDPTNPASLNLGNALTALTVAPNSFVLTINSVQGEGSRQLVVTGALKDGTTIDLTSTQRGTNYQSSDLNVCNFGSPDGRVFGGQGGNCTITITNGGKSTTATVTVTNFNPIAISRVAIPGFANNVDISGGFAYVAAGASGLQVVNVGNRAAPVVVGALDTPGNANDVRVVGNIAYIADGSAGLQIVNVTVPTNPVLVGALDTPGEAWDVVVSGNRAYVADGVAGLRIIDVTNPAEPVLLGSVDPTGTQKGVDIDPVRMLAVVASGTSGLHVVNVANPAAPTIVGTLTGGDVRDVAVQNAHAFLADAQRSMTSVDLTNPAQPLLRTSTPQNLGGLLNGIVVQGNFALGADVFFVNGVPIVAIDAPDNPISRAILNFANLGDSDGQGIAADAGYVYLAAVAGSAFIENGASGTSHLYIGQYIAIQDLGGVPPTVSITAPLPNSSVIEGTPVPVRVSASDDIAVAGVTFLVNGSSTFTDTSEPFEFVVNAPAAPGPLVLGARAVDFGGNIGTAGTVSVGVTPDPLTTVSGRVVDATGTPVVGATVTLLAFSTTTGQGGNFTIPGVSTVQGKLVARALALVAGKTVRGASAAFTPVVGGTTNVGTITLRQVNVLLLVDSDGGGATALVAALTAAGIPVTRRPAPEYTFDGTNPSLQDFTVVIHLDGTTYTSHVTPAGQQALVQLVNNGGGFIGLQWLGYERQNSYTTGMNDLILFGHPGPTNCGPCNVTYNVVPGQGDHPVLAGLPISFSFTADGHADGALFPYSVNPPTVLMRTTAGGPAVAVRNFGAGRVVNYAFAANYSGQQSLTIANVQKLIINSVLWAGGGQ